VFCSLRLIINSLKRSTTRQISVLHIDRVNIFYVHVTVHRDMWPCIVINFFIIRPTTYTNFTNLFLALNSTCFVQFVCPSSEVYSLYTRHWYMSYRFVDSFRAGSGWNSMEFHPDPARKLSTNMYDKYHCWVYSEWTPDDRQRHSPKNVEFNAKNKFVKLVLLVGLIIRKRVNVI